jgi:hypothetical protein
MLIKMIKFKHFLYEAAITDTSKLSHLDHASSIAMHNEHFDKSHNFLSQMHGFIQGSGKPPEGFTEKKDGGVSIVMYRHPDTGKVGVGYKTSVFAKSPKLNYSPEDIDTNHSNNPVVADTLKQALEHADKILPKGKGKDVPFMQGDVLFKAGEVKKGAGKVSYQPNVIKYSHSASSPEGKLVQQAKFGIHLHTGYKPSGEGSWPHNLQADYSADFSKLKHSGDVFVTTPGYNGNASYHGGEAEQVQKHLDRAKELNSALTPAEHSVINNHFEHLNSYINMTKRAKEVPSHEGYIAHLGAKAQRDIDSVKTEKAKQSKKEKWDNLAAEATKNKKTIENTLNTQSHLQAATDIMTKALDRGLGRESEGYMGTVGGHALKAIHTDVSNRITSNLKFNKPAGGSDDQI